MNSNLNISINNDKTILISEKILKNKIRFILSTIGFNERYQPFDYLSELIFFMIKNGDEGLLAYKENLKTLAEHYNISSKTIMAGLGKLFKNCNENLVKERAQFNLVKCSTLNKLRVIKNYILNTLSNI